MIYLHALEFWYLVAGNAIQWLRSYAQIHWHATQIRIELVVSIETNGRMLHFFYTSLDLRKCFNWISFTPLVTLFPPFLPHFVVFVIISCLFLACIAHIQTKVDYFHKTRIQTCFSRYRCARFVFSFCFDRCRCLLPDLAAFPLFIYHTPSCIIL